MLWASNTSADGIKRLSCLDQQTLCWWVLSPAVLGLADLGRESATERTFSSVNGELEGLRCPWVRDDIFSEERFSVMWLTDRLPGTTAS